MGLLDSDAEELKNSAKAAPSPTPSGSGRKVNQSGLGAFKGLSKYSSLTAKYRQSAAAVVVAPENNGDKSKDTKNLTVEHGHGTLSKNEATSPLLRVQDLAHDLQASANSVQTTGKVSASESVAVFEQDKIIDNKVSANSVHDQGEVSANDSKGFSTQDNEGELKLGANSVQSLAEVSANKLTVADKADEIQKMKVSANSVQQAANTPSLGTRSEKIVPSIQTDTVPGDLPITVVEVSATTSKLDFHQSDITPSEASANSVQSQCDVGELEQIARPDLNAKVLVKSDINPVQTQLKVGANSVQGVEDDVAQGSLKTTLATEISDRTTSDLLVSTHLLSPHNHSEVSANPVRTQSVTSTNSVHSQAKVSAALQAAHEYETVSQGELRSEVRAPVGAKLVRAPCKLEPLESVSSLAGAQRLVITFLFERCVWNHGVITPPITKQQLIEATQLPEQTVLSAVKRLRKKLIIDRYSYKDGKAGWTQYILSAETYRELLHLRQYSANSVQSPAKVGPIVSSAVGAEASNSSNSYKKEEPKENTNTNNFDSLPKEWRDIDLSLLGETHCRMSRADLVDIQRTGMLTAQDVQDSVAHLHHDLTMLKKHVDRNVFFGVIKKKGAPWFSQDYVRQIEKEISDQLSAATRVKTARVEQVRAQEELEFQTWLASLTPEEKTDMAKEMPIKNTTGKLFESFAIGFYRRRQDSQATEGGFGSADIARKIEESLAGVTQ